METPIADAYQRSLEELDRINYIEEPGGLTARDVLKAHFLVANHFYLEGHGLGGLGPKNMTLLLSAVDRQHVAFGGRKKWTDRFDICATLFYGLIKNHAFHDANKRTAFLSVLYLLYRFDRCPAVSEREFEDFTVEIADDSLQKYARYNELVKSKDPDPEVKYISKYLRTKTRQIDTTSYAITYRELKAILNRHGCDLSNPRGNYIDVVRIERSKKLFGFIGGEKVFETRLCQIGFPRWGAEVGKAALKTVRESTNLSARHGVDSAAFFNGRDPMQSLIASYNEPLMSLANR